MDLLKKLSELDGVSGNEEAVRNFIKKEIRPYVDDVSIDKFGNLICRKRGRAPRVMLAAHMDEVGLMVKNIENNGLMFLSPIGYLEPDILVGDRVKIRTNRGMINGVITTKNIINDEVTSKIKMEELCVDVGMNKKDLSNLGIRIGSYVSLDRAMITLGNKDFISGKALDDRVGCYILIQLAKKLKNVSSEIFFVFTVQEEVGLYGAKTSTYSVEPDWGIAIDVVESDEFHYNATKFLGKGCVITVKDSDMIANKKINDWLVSLAKKKKIPVQLEVSDTGTTDAMNISLSKGGVPSTVVGVPVRNLHTTISVVNKKDIDSAIKLLSELLKSAHKEKVV
jgi:tetrahedral aminopeptidase